MFSKLSDNDAQELLATGRVARLGCIVNDAPYVVPISYYFEGGYAYSHSLPGLKISALRDNPKACLQVDQIESDFSWRSAIALGEYEEIADPTERKEVLGRILSRFPMLTPVESAIANDGGPPPVIVFRIKIEKITGVAEG
jgi:nitroimidazol reductase NimA-like FMN-containing flavoprotein (pyridoxamine 5'-phosphate oxidase superfamily)